MFGAAHIFLFLSFCLNSKPESKLISNNCLTKEAFVLAWARGFQVVARCHLSRTPAGPEPWKVDDEKSVKGAIESQQDRGPQCGWQKSDTHGHELHTAHSGPVLITSLTVQDSSNSPLRDYI